MNNNTTAVQKVEPLPVTEIISGGAFSSIQRFEDAQRIAKVLCASSIVPQSYRENLADCIIALEMSNRIGANPLAVMQNLYIVHGRPAWSSQFLISCINASGKFTPLRYREIGKRNQDDWGCIAWAQDKSGEVLESPEVTLGMAKAEGWYGRNGSKWKTMPQLMLRYRAATLFARLFAPELTMGIQCDEEIVDITPVVTEPRTKPSFAPEPKQLPPTPEAAPTQPQTPPQPPAEETIAQSGLRVTREAEVTFYDFRSFIATKNIAKDSDSWASWDEVPTAVWEILHSQSKTFVELLRKFGKVQGK